MTPEELRTQLLVEEETKPEETVRSEGAPQTLSEMEALALKIGQAVKEWMMPELVSAVEELEIAERCPGVD